MHERAVCSSSPPVVVEINRNGSATWRVELVYMHVEATVEVRPGPRSRQWNSANLGCGLKSRSGCLATPVSSHVLIGQAHVVFWTDTNKLRFSAPG